ncbi:MAG: DUF4469 domain-containing protein [Tannerellaceae bacterium]|jgi:hypothetical protein|nr:DUF4469 domain-containing protein [Tannerellaceae bacterium]
MAKKFLWKLWLRFNAMTKDVDNDYFAEVSTAGHTLRVEDIANRIIEEGSEVKFETLLDIFTKGDRIKREALLSGTSVLDGVAHFTPRVTGNWPGATHRFDPEKHRITLDISPSAELRKSLGEEVEVEVLGIRDSGAYIGLITDLSTGLSNNTIVRGQAFSVEGIKIRIEPDDVSSVGLFFQYIGPVESPVPPIRLTSRPIQNSAGKLVFLLPTNIEKGPYQLYVVTRFSNGTTLLRDPRTITYAETVTIADSNTP